MKNTMNQANVAKMNKMLKAEVSLAKISKALGIKEACLKRFITKPKAPKTQAPTK